MRYMFKFERLVFMLPTAACLLSPVAGAESGETRHAVVKGVVTPQLESQASAQVPMSAAAQRALIERKLEIREEFAAAQPGAEAGPAGLAAVVGRESPAPRAAVGEFPPNPQLLSIGRNNRNTNANNAAKGSTLAEPAAANNALRVFAAGNLNHAEISTNGGVTWTDVPLPGGPADAPTQLGDHDVLIDDARRVTFHSALYVNAALNNGVVRIFVRRTPPAFNCFFDIDPAGTANNILPDYPHIGVTKRFLYDDQ